LIELLVVIAIIALLIGLLLPAVQKVREASARSRCTNNMKQLALGIHSFNSQYQMMPTYYGVFPVDSSSHANQGGVKKMYGGWFTHILPFIDQAGVYNAAMDNIIQNGANTSSSSGGSSSPTGSTTTTVTYPDGTTYTIDVPAGTTTTRATSTSYGIFRPEFSKTVFGVMVCGSDSTRPANGLNGNWATTSYQANWNALGDSMGLNGSSYFGEAEWSPSTYGIYCSPRKFGDITDGVSNTVLIGEVYQNCDNSFRHAMKPNGNSFGITGGIRAGSPYNSPGIKPYTSTPANNGIPNVLKFQIQPLALKMTETYSNGTLQLPAADPKCKTADCCDSRHGQTPHSVYPVALVDGSVRTVTNAVSDDAWKRVMLPRDGLELDSTW